MFRILRSMAILAVALVVTEPAFAQVKPTLRITQPNYNTTRPLQPGIKPPLPLLVKIKPSQAAALAKRSMPNSKVLGVKLLPSGDYAVTLKANNEVARVTVDGTTGSVN